MARERIASLLAGATEMLYGLGLGERVVAVSHECDHPAEVAGKPRVTFTRVDDRQSSDAIDVQVRETAAAGNALYQIDVDRLAALAPDLIVTQAQCDVCAVSYDDVLTAVRTCDALAGTEVVALDPNTLEDVFADIGRVGAAAGGADAASYINGLRRRVDAIRRETDRLAAADRVRVACIEWIDPVMIAANWMPELIEIAGGWCGLTKTGVPSGYTRWDDVVTYDPEGIVVMPCGFDLDRAVAESAVLNKLPGWDTISATKSGRVYAVDGNAYFNRSGPRLIDSLEILAGLLHPTLFADAQATSDGVWCTLR